MDKNSVKLDEFKYSLLDDENILFIGFSLELIETLEEMENSSKIEREYDLFLNLLENAMLETAKVSDYHLLIRLGLEDSLYIAELEDFIAKAMRLRVKEDIVNACPKWIRIPVRVKVSDLDNIMGKLGLISLNSNTALKAEAKRILAGIEEFIQSLDSGE